MTEKEVDDNTVEKSSCESCGRSNDDDLSPLKLQFSRGEFICEDCRMEFDNCGCSDQ